MKDEIEKIKVESTEELKKIQDLKELETFKVKYLGKKGSLTTILRGMKDLSAEERPVIGSLVNQVRDLLENLISEKEKE